MSSVTPQPSKTPLHLPFIIVAVLVLVGFVLYWLLLRDRLAAEAGSFATFFLGALAVVTSFAALVYQLGKQAADIAEIRSNTNGRSTAQDQRIAMLESQLRQEGHVPVTTGAALTPAASTE